VGVLSCAFSREVAPFVDIAHPRDGEEEDAARIIERETQYANQWVGESTPEEPKRKPRKLGKVEGSDKPQGARSIFDGIDADEHAEGE